MSRRNGPAEAAAAHAPRPRTGLAALLDMQTLILRDIAAGHPAAALAERLCDLAEQHAPGRIASLMRMRPDGRLGVLAAPAAPAPLRAALDGLQPGPGAGSCGVAIHTGAPAMVEDAATDPRWQDLRGIAATHGIRSCWSHPIRQGGRVLGTFALTGPDRALPDPATGRMLEHCTAIAGSILLLAELQEERERQDRRLRRVTGFNAMLAQANQLAASRPDQAALYDGICRIAVQHGGVRLAWVGAPDATQQFQVFAAAGATGFLAQVFVTADPALPEGRGLSGIAWRDARTIVRQRFAPDTMLGSWLEAARSFGLGAGAAMPLRLRGQPVAVLHVYADEEGVLDAELVALLEELAGTVGRALEALDQERRFHRLAGLHAALLAEGEVLLEAQSDAEMLRRTCERLADGALFHLAWVARPDEEGVLRRLAGAGPGLSDLIRLRVTLADTPPSVTARCWLADKTEYHNHLPDDPGLARLFEVFRVTGWRSVIAVPIHRGQALFAVLVLGSREAGLFDAELMALCERIAQLLGRGLDAFDLKEALERERGRQFQLARHDALTGLPNRLQFEEHLARALARSRRQDRPLAVCLLDLDDFKPVNDSFGHAAGDTLLRQAAGRLREGLRRSDLIARLGGDEFVLAIEDLGTATVLPALLDRMNEALARPFDLGEGRSVRIGLSMGVAVAPDDGDEPDLLMRRADAALYAAKARKAARTENWRRWTPEIAQADPPALGLTDAYGPEAARLLSNAAALWPAIIGAFIAEFYRDLAQQPAAARVLGALSATEMEKLRAAQTRHLLHLVTPVLDREAVERAARPIGRTHALVGVDGALMVQAAGLLQTSLGEHLATRPLRPLERQNLMAAIALRLQDDSAAQMQAHSRTLAAFFDHLLGRAPAADAPWTDVVQGELDALAALPGIRGCGLMQPDAAGRFQVLASSSGFGLTFDRVRAATGLTPAISPDRPEGRGLTAAAWQSGELQTAANFLDDPRTAPWRAVARRFGVHSSAALPVKDADDRPVAVLTLLGAYPGQFESHALRHFCNGLAQRLWLLWRQRRAVAAAMVPEGTAQAWRRRLFAGGLVMHYQPLVDLRTGRTVKAEALARLVLEDGREVAPGAFLPVLGARDLDTLFRRGLAAALAQTAAWDAAGLSLGVAVNLPPSTLAQPDCAFWVAEALRQAGVAPERLDLEITEEQPVGAVESASAATLAALARLGVNIVMDDLGAGYSSLQRLRSLPFRAIKIDQGLVAGMRQAPLKTVGFLGALVQLGHDLEVEVVAEGLESVGMIEAAAFLGASVGQGYGLARPMPGDDLAGWLRDFRWPVDRADPRTPLGALALLWRASQREGAGLGPAVPCPVSRFIVRRGLAGGALDAAHRALHAAAAEGLRSPPYQAALHAMQRALVALALAEEAGEAEGAPPEDAARAVVPVGG